MQLVDCSNVCYLHALHGVGCQHMLAEPTRSVLQGRPWSTFLDQNLPFCAVLCRAALCCVVVCAGCLQAILDNSRSPYAQLLASSSLLKLVTEHQLS